MGWESIFFNTLLRCGTGATFGFDTLRMRGFFALDGSLSVTLGIAFLLVRPDDILSLFFVNVKVDKCICKSYTLDAHRKQDIKGDIAKPRG